MDISNTYFHTMSISRIVDTIDSFGGTKQDYAPVPLLQLISCGYSQGSRNKNTTQTESSNVISYNPKLFCNPNLDIRTGDRVEIRYDIRVIGEFTAAEPYLYNSHQEVSLIKLGEA